MQLVSCEFSAVPRWGAALRCGPPRPAAFASKKPAASSSAPRSAASRRDDAEFSRNGGGGRLVDEGMVVLRRRINEMRAAERSWEPPAEWAASEKERCGSHDADVRDLAGALLQACLRSSRPGSGSGLVLVLMLAVPAFAFVLVSHLVDASRAPVSSLNR